MNPPPAAAAPSPAPAGPAAARQVPGWLPWLFVLLLTVPFHPDWVDAEQARRALLLLLSGGLLLLRPGLPAVAGERLFWWFLAALGAAGLVNGLYHTLWPRPGELASFQPLEALYRVAHWLALLVVVWLGAGQPQRFAKPLATALLATALFGLLQRLGVANIAGYGVEREPVSTLGNLNVAAEWTTIAAAAVAVLLPRDRLGLLAVGVGSAYLVVNGSRSGLLALPIALGLLAILRRRDHGWVPLATAALGGLLGLLLALLGPTPTSTTPSGPAVADRSPSTLEVRLEIARSATRLFAESPIYGHGPGQFAVQYPRVRSAREIELSSLDRQFATEVRTAHDDWLEILVETGLAGFALFAAALFALQRATRDKARLVPLFALLLVMFVRAPILNAPAAVAALLLVATPAVAARAPRRWLRRLLGGLLVVLAIPPLVAQFAFTPVVRAAATGRPMPLAAVQTAVAWQPWEPRWRQVEAQLLVAANRLPDARKAAALTVALRPFDPQLSLLLGEVLARGTAYQEARQVAQHGLRQDPQHPELRMLLATTQALGGQPDDAVVTLATDPHPRLRPRLRGVFRDLADQAAVRGDTKAEARLRFEEHLEELLPMLGQDTTGPTDVGRLDAAGGQVRQVLASARAAERTRTDLRPYVVAALHALDVGDDAQATALGDAARKLGVPLLPWQRALLGPHLQRLQELPGWAPLLR